MKIFLAFSLFFVAINEICTAVNVSNASIISQLPGNTEIVNIPTIFYPGTSLALNPPEIYYYKIYQCSGCIGDVSNKNAQLSLILPYNVAWDTTNGYVLVELSTSPNKWDSSTVFATNYIWNGGIKPVLYSTVVWKYNNVTSFQNWFYLRITPKITHTIMSFEMTYVDDSVPLVSGSFDPAAFKAPSADPSWKNIYQFARTVSTAKVLNHDILLLKVKFCPEMIADLDYDIHYSIVADVDYPKSAFNLFICSANFGTDCDSNTACVAQFSGSSVGYVAISSNAGCDLDNGILFGAYGIGGNKDAMNYFEAGITMSKL